MPEYENPEAGWELETDAQEPIQVDAGYDDDCCNEILQLYLSNLSRQGLGGRTYRGQELGDYLAGMDCKTLLDIIGDVSVDSHNPNHSWQQLQQEQRNPEKTLRDAYQECVTAKMPQGGDFTAGDPMDLAWRLLKHA